MTFQEQLIATANALGMNPVDLATIISYETAGTFDPTKAGPTTQWGQHKGLIQFGEPQAKEYGVDWNDPLNSQLGPDGAVANYFRANGWKPGMGMLDAYSIVNAGAPGKYNASDAGNGGAPGTVADKVNNQMGPHREKALGLLGGADLSFGEVKPAQPGILPPLSMGTVVEVKQPTIWDKMTEIMKTAQETAPPPMQLAPIQRAAYTPQQVDRLAPYLKFFQSVS